MCLGTCNDGGHNSQYTPIPVQWGTHITVVTQGMEHTPCCSPQPHPPQLAGHWAGEEGSPGQSHTKNATFQSRKDKQYFHLQLIDLGCAGSQPTTRGTGSTILLHAREAESGKYLVRIAKDFYIHLRHDSHFLCYLLYLSERLQSSI